MAFKPKSNKTNKQIKKIPTKLKPNKGFIKKERVPLENKIILEHNPVEKQTWGQITKKLIGYLLPLIFLIFLSWLMFYKIVPQIGAAINQAGTKALEYTKDKAHDIKEYFYHHFKNKWNCPEWLSKTGSIITPILIGLAIAAGCLSIPVIGPFLGGIVLVGTIVIGSFMLFTDKTTPPIQPPKEDVVVIDHNKDKLKDKEAQNQDTTKKLN
ncbi:hypothetical protein CWO85_03305 [Candidatus Phytoplasma ziziphi]|uniref:Uncharacterized protein n=1 Tax=Ziziphus jujuba witches'-broom phytoplasma TaxID=135727 RepID=A0A660HN84_ZIZJU|nr:hypothetical protein [Candidatus Phytoplasma ziziphi]AYJ01503.1 hypothetical protein CWO85_03305 [Candidatus Phytoplasma ziziphi]